VSQERRFVAYAAAQNYLAEKYGLRPVTPHTQREWIRAGRFPAPIVLSPSRKVFTQDQLDGYAEALLAQVQP
jgi:hypothetical protein